MTGRDIVLMIIKHNLMDEEFGVIVDDDCIFLNINQAAVKLGVSTTSLEDMVKLDLIDYVMIDGQPYLHKDIQLTTLKRR